MPSTNPLHLTYLALLYQVAEFKVPANALLFLLDDDVSSDEHSHSPIIRLWELSAFLGLHLKREATCLGDKLIPATKQ